MTDLDRVIRERLEQQRRHRVMLRRLRQEELAREDRASLLEVFRTLFGLSHPKEPTERI